MMAGSEIAHFRQQQQLEEQSALLGLLGSAAVASHAAIEAYALWESMHTL